MLHAYWKKINTILLKRRVPLNILSLVYYKSAFCVISNVYRQTEMRSKMRALDWARAGIKISQLNDSSRSSNILFSIFRISIGLRYWHKQNLSIYYNI